MNVVKSIHSLRQLLGPKHETLGARGEQAAARWLQKRGYRILERNMSLGGNEADLVALDPDRRTIAIVEVKTRQSGDTLPEYSVTRAKRVQLSKFASRLQKRSEYRDRAIRFDVVAIVWPEDSQPEVSHHVGAFDSPW